MLRRIGLEDLLACPSAGQINRDRWVFLLKRQAGANVYLEVTQMLGYSWLRHAADLWQQQLLNHVPPFGQTP